MPEPSENSQLWQLERQVFQLSTLFEVADAVISAYRRDKNRRGLVDYDDLIERTRGPCPQALEDSELDSVDEAILLGDRVVVMTTRPGRIRQIESISLDRPRYGYDARGTKEFIEIREHIWELLSVDAKKHARATPEGD